MVSINKIISTPFVQPKVLKNTTKIFPYAAGISVLAGAGMGGAVGCGPRTEDVADHVSGAYLDDPLLDQITYGANQIKDFGVEIADGISSTVDGATNLASAAGGAVLDGIDSVTDSAADIAARALIKILDTVG